MKNNSNISKLEIEELKNIGKYNNRSIKRLEEGYPVQYLIGYVNFYGNKILVNKNTLIPRYETEYLIEKTIKYIKKYSFDNPKILDMCTGTGAIGLTLKKEIPSSEVNISDISLKALKVAKKNRKNLGLDINIIRSDLYKNIKDKDYDILISNPPYVMDSEILPVELKYEPKLALFSGKEGTDHIKQILIGASKHLKQKYIIALEINEKSEKPLTDFIIKNLDHDIKYLFEKDLAGKTRYLFIFKNCE